MPVEIPRAPGATLVRLFVRLSDLLDEFIHGADVLPDDSPPSPRCGRDSDRRGRRWGQRSEGPHMVPVREDPEAGGMNGGGEFLTGPGRMVNEFDASLGSPEDLQREAEGAEEEIHHLFEGPTFVVLWVLELDLTLLTELGKVVSVGVEEGGVPASARQVVA